MNLHLKVTGRRPDGFHDLSSCFLYLDEPGDILTVTGGVSGLKVECPGYDGLDGEGNILYRSAELFAAAAGIAPEWQMVLEKRVPIAAGMGGGSADAGGLLNLLNRHYNIFSGDELAQLAFSIGADVPFFLYGRSAWVSGAGEKIEFLSSMPDIPEILIVNPGFPVSAKWAYRHLSAANIGEESPVVRKNFESGVVDWREFCINDLAPAVMKKFPLLQEMSDFLQSSGALSVQISGSGPTLFALFERGSAAAAGQFREKFGDCSGIKIFSGGMLF